MVETCLFCGGQLLYVGIVQNQHKYKCESCERAVRSLVNISGNADNAFEKFKEEPEEEVVVEEVERDPDAEYYG